MWIQLTDTYKSHQTKWVKILIYNFSHGALYLLEEPDFSIGT